MECVIATITETKRNGYKNTIQSKKMEETIMRITFNRACERIYNHYGRENVLQIRKPDNKQFYVVDLVEGTVHLYREDLIRM